MRPTVTMPGADLYLGDCLRVLPTLADGSVDAVVTDPPFGVREDEWDRMDGREFARFSMAWLSQAARVSEELISFCSAYGPFRALCEMLYPRVRVMVWDKPIGSQYAGSSERGLWFAHEAILHGYQGSRARTYVTPKVLTVARMIAAARVAVGLSRGAVDVALRGKKTGLCYRWEEGACLPTPEQAAALRPLLGLGEDFVAALEEGYRSRNATLRLARAGAAEDGAEARDVFSFRTETDADHPCQKPLALMRELVRRLTEPGDVILDPFMGSGTTGLAALSTGRRFMGVESDPGYFEVARKRLADCDGPLFASAQPSLFPGETVDFDSRE